MSLARDEEAAMSGNGGGSRRLFAHVYVSLVMAQRDQDGRGEGRRGSGAKAMVTSPSSQAEVCWMSEEGGENRGISEQLL